MSTSEDFTTKLPVLQAIPLEAIKMPNVMPVDTYIQEAEALHHWCQKDMDLLIAKGVVWTDVEDIPVRCGALREAESAWNTERFSRQEAEAQWAVESPAAYKLRNSLIHEMRFAYYGDANLTKKVGDIADGNTHADMLQDLNDLSVLGKKFPDPLVAIGFDMTLLDTAAETADRLASLYAVVVGDRVEYSESKKLRDQAYTHLKEIVDELYRVGQYLFWHTDHRRQGYRSAFLYRRYLNQLASSGSTGETGTDGSGSLETPQTVN